MGIPEKERKIATCFNRTWGCGQSWTGEQGVVEVIMIKNGNPGKVIREHCNFSVMLFTLTG